MQITFYGPLRDLVAPEILGGLPSGLRTVGAVRAWFAHACPGSAETLASPRLRTALDDRLVGDEAPLAGAHRLDFLPPLSGG